MNKKLIITVRVNEYVGREFNKNVPYTPEEIAETESAGIADQEQPEEPVTTRAAQMVQEQTVTQLQQSGEEQNNPLQYQSPLWTQLGLLDVAACAGLAWGVLFVWDYILANL